MRGLRAVLFLLGLILCAAPARASVSFTVVFDALVEESTAVVVETPIESKSVWENGHIVTYTKVHVDRLVAGSAPSEVWVETLGGVVGEIGQQVEGEAVLRTEHQSLLFLSAYQTGYVVTARGQGQFPIAPDASGALRIRRNLHPGALIAPRDTVVARIRAATSYAPAASPAADVLDGKSIADAATEISGAWRRTHAAP